MAIKISKSSSSALRSQTLGHRSTLASVRRCLRATGVLGSFSCILALWTHGITSARAGGWGFIHLITSLGCSYKWLCWQKFPIADPADELSQTIIWSHWDISNLAEPFCKTWIQRFCRKECYTVCGRHNTATNPARLWLFPCLHFLALILLYFEMANPRATNIRRSGTR